VNRRLVFRPEAEEEIFGAAEWYEKRKLGLSTEFLRALDAVVAAVERNPFQFPQVHGEKRRALLRRFPYGVIYSVSDEEIVVLACSHARLNPLRWHRRR
jgi:plasmid stabilization system protein ParE